VSKTHRDPKKTGKIQRLGSLFNSVHAKHSLRFPDPARGLARRWRGLAFAMLCACGAKPETKGGDAGSVGGTRGGETVTSSGGASSTTTIGVGGNSTTVGAVGSGDTVSSVGSASSTTSAAGGATSTGSGGTQGSGGTSTSDGASSVGSETVTGAGGSAGGGTMGVSSTTGGPLGPTTVWIAGDSTVANGNTPCPAGWGKHFAPYFDDLVTIKNSAVGGRSVRTWLYNVTTEMDSTGECVLLTDGSGEPTLQARWQEMLDGMQAGDTLIIQFGINDGSATCDRHVGLEAFKESYAMMAEVAVARGAQPVFVTPVSAIACDGTTARATRGGYVDATFEVGAATGVPVIDLHQLSIDLYNTLGFCPVPGGDVSASTTGPVGDFFCDDHTHFSDSGAVDIAGLVANALEGAGVALSEHLLE